MQASPTCSRGDDSLAVVLQLLIVVAFPVAAPGLEMLRLSFRILVAEPGIKPISPECAG